MQTDRIWIKGTVEVAHADTCQMTPHLEVVAVAGSNLPAIRANCRCGEATVTEVDIHDGRNGY